MSTKNTAKKSSGAKTAASKSKKVTTNKTGKVTGVTNQEIIEGGTELEPGNNQTASGDAVATNAEQSGPVESESPKAKSAQTPKAKTKKETQKKPAVSSKSVATNDKKIKLASTTYHYYRNWLAEFLRSHGASSARFSKSPDSYQGHITILESEQPRGIKALEQWSKQNPDVKDIFAVVKK